MTANAAIGKIKASRVNNLEAAEYVGPSGQIWYDVLTGVLRLGDNVTPGGTIIGGGGGNGTPSGPNTSIQFNNNGAFGGNATFTFDSANANVSLNGNLLVGGNSKGHVFIQSGMTLYSNTITESFTLPAGFNGLSAGPITTVDGANIFIPDGQRWTVV